MSGTSIQIFLPSGEPRGLRVAEMTTRIVQAIQIPRTKLDEFYKREESQQVGVYYLFGESPEGTMPRVYIGQTEDFKTRLRSHNNTKEFWQSAVAIVSKTQSFTQAHIRYMEWLSITHGQEAKRYLLDNANAGSRPFLTEPMEADVTDAFEVAKTLLSTLGFPLFDKHLRKASSEEKIFRCIGPSAEGRGVPSDDGFVIFEGSLVRSTPTATAPSYLKAALEELVQSDILQTISEDQFRFTRDHVVKSPSYAAALVLARNANGWIEWKLSDGRSLHDVYRADDIAVISSDA